MRKLLAVFTFMLAFAAGANAQDKKMSAEELAKMDAIKMAKELNLSETRQMDFQRLFTMKHEILNDPNMSEERKKEMSRMTDLKIRATLTSEQMEKLEKNPQLLAQLTGGQQATEATLQTKQEKKK